MAAPGLDTTSDGWKAALQAKPPAWTVAPFGPLESSSRLEVSWVACPPPPERALDHYRLEASEPVGATVISGEVPASATAATLAGLKSATSYTITLVACGDPGCTLRLEPEDGPAYAATRKELWQVLGAADGPSRARQVSSLARGPLAAFAYGEGGPDSTEGRVRLYHGPTSVYSALSSGAPDGTAASVASFAPAEVLASPGSAAVVTSPAAAYATPLSPAMGKRVRLYFDGIGADGRSRVFYLDSRDALGGADFHADEGHSTCATAQDYAPGGGCAPGLAIALAGDLPAPNPRVEGASRLRLGTPTLDDWLWGGTPGTFAVFEIEMAAQCPVAEAATAYASWDGKAFQVSYGEDGCPRVFEDVRGATPAHLGDVRYKLYFSRPSHDAARPEESPWAFGGTKKVLYADGRTTSAPTRVDFEDWEAISSGRDIDFVWPSGAKLSDTEEGLIGDMVVVMPSGDLLFQVMYLTTTDGALPPIATTAALLNP